MLWHQSGVNMKGEPFVQLILDDKVIGQMTPSEARDHARAVTEAAEASETDAFLMAFVKNELKGTKQAATDLMLAFRRYREGRGKSGPPSDAGEFVR